MRILSYNIQAAIHSQSYLSYSYQWPRHILPTPQKQKTLEKIAEFIRPFDIVCLQEVELGGLRNGFKSHKDQLIKACEFPYHISQITRKISRLSWHGKLILSRIPLQETLNTPLPSSIPGRGILAAEIQTATTTLTIANIHLSLGQIDQHHQLRFIRTRLQHKENVLLCGDFNTSSQNTPLRILTEHGYHLLGSQQKSFPSWNPQKDLDHALLKGNLKAHAEILPFIASDHLPLAIELKTN